jgi:hypothetical protein
MFRALAIMLILPTTPAALLAASDAPPNFVAARQLTFDSYHHNLTNANVWSPDGRRIVYDIRSPGQFDGKRIEEVDVLTGDKRTLYQNHQGAHCGVATFDSREERVVFILGPENPAPDWTYGFTRRRGVLVETDRPGEIRPLDAMNYRPPFTPGALRGGSHLHVFSPDGKWVSFTYDDEILAQLDISPGKAAHEPNQRNLGIALPHGPVHVAKNYPWNHDGDWFSVLVTRTSAQPELGSDEISRASEEAWVGINGYIRIDGVRQARALAFQGEVVAADGSKYTEVFIVDLPDDLTREGSSPLAGTLTTRPAPPSGVSQRRLTHTSQRRYPGLAPAPRHWLRSAPDGSAIAFLQKDDAGVVQLWTISPNGGTPRQVTRNSYDIASSFTWSPDGRFITHVMDRSICLTEMATGTTTRLTNPAMKDMPLPTACVYSPAGDKICFSAMSLTPVGSYTQIYIVNAYRQNPGPESAMELR